MLLRKVRDMGRIRRMAKSLGINTYQMKKRISFGQFKRKKAISIVTAPRGWNLARSLPVYGETIVYP